VKKSTTNSIKPATKTGTITRLPSKRARTVSPVERCKAEGIDLPQVMSELEQTSAVNASRVVKLHDRIAAGEYSINAARLSQQILDFESRLPP